MVMLHSVRKQRDIDTDAALNFLPCFRLVTSVCGIYIQANSSHSSQNTRNMFKDRPRAMSPKCDLKSSQVND